MQVRCPRCQTPRELAQRPALDSAISVTCASCGQSFRVRGKARTASLIAAVPAAPPPLPPEELPEPPAAETPTATWRVRRRDGTILEFPNLRIFQRWVADGAISLDDAISRNARPFRPITEIPELVGLFERAEQVRAQTSASRVTPVPPELPPDLPELPEPAVPELPQPSPVPTPGVSTPTPEPAPTPGPAPAPAPGFTTLAAEPEPVPEPEPQPASTPEPVSAPAPEIVAPAVVAPEPVREPAAEPPAPAWEPTLSDSGDRTLTDSRLEGLEELRRAEAAAFSFDPGPAPASVFDPGPAPASVFDSGPAAASVFDAPRPNDAPAASASWSPSKADLAGFLDDPPRAGPAQSSMAQSSMAPSGPAMPPVDEDELFGNTMQLKSSDIQASLGAAAPAPISFDVAPKRGVAHPPLEAPGATDEPAPRKPPGKRWLWIALSAVAISVSGFAAWFVFGRTAATEASDEDATKGEEGVAKAPPARPKRAPPRRDPEEEQRAEERAVVLYVTSPAEVVASPAVVAAGNGGEHPKTGEPKTGEPKTGEPKTGEPKTGEPKTVEPKTVEPKTVEKPKPGEKPIPAEPVTPPEVVGKPPTDGYDALLADASAAEQAGRLSEAVSLLGKAAAMNPSSVEPIAKLAWVYLKLGDGTNAILKFQEAKRRNPGYRDTYVGLAKALEMSGRTPEAIDIYRQFLRLCPACKKAESVKQALVRLGATP